MRLRKHVPFHYTENSLVWTFLSHTQNIEYNPSPGNLGKVTL